MLCFAALALAVLPVCAESPIRFGWNLGYQEAELAFVADGTAPELHAVVTELSLETAIGLGIEFSPARFSFAAPPGNGGFQDAAASFVNAGAYWNLPPGGGFPMIAPYAKVHCLRYDFAFGGMDTSFFEAEYGMRVQFLGGAMDGWFPVLFAAKIGCQYRDGAYMPTVGLTVNLLFLPEWIAFVLAHGGV
jgi:hypothetical protein